MRNQLIIIALAVSAASNFTFAENNKSILEVDKTNSTVIWTGKKVTGEHSGTIEILSGELEFSGAELSGGSFTIDMQSIKNTDLQDEAYRAKLENHLKSEDFFSTAKHPKARFEITQVAKKSDTDYDVTGDIEIKGIPGTITFPVQLNKANGQTAATGVITIDRSKFDVKYGSGSFFDNLGDKMIDDKFTLNISLTAK